MHIDPEWINPHWPTEPKVVVQIKFESYTRTDIQLLVYGDDSIF